jgi:hypothetical protein
MTMSRSTTMLTVAALALAAACGGRDAGPPVATATLAVSPDRAPLGSPITMSYRFQVAAGASFDANYRVMVHFVDADGGVMWTDDHNPPVPTSQWKPGQTIEYTRTTFLPVYPYLGQATIQIGLYNPSTQRRLVLAGEDAGQRAYKAAAIELEPQSEGIFVVYGDGWQPAEVSPQNSLDEWRWTKQEASWSFRNPKRDVVVYLDLDGRPDAFPAPQQVTVKAGDQVVDSFTVTSPDRMLRTIEIAAAALGTGDVVTMTLGVDRTFVPARLPGGGSDDRQLGVRVFHLVVEAK